MVSIRCQSADRHEAVEVWMEKQILTPAVQDGEEPDLCAEVLRVGCYF
jgi:hypothetical protein